MDMRRLTDYLFTLFIFIFLMFMLNAYHFFNLTDKSQFVQYFHALDRPIGFYKYSRCSNITYISPVVEIKQRTPVVEIQQQIPAAEETLTASESMSQQESQTQLDDVTTFQPDFSNWDPLYRESARRKNSCVKGIDFSDRHWWEQAEQQQQCIFKDYKREIPEYVLNKFKDDGGKLYSQVYFNQTEGIAWGYLKNVCYNMKTQFMELYKPTEDKIIRGRIEGFQHLWVYKEFVGEMKEQYQINRGLNAWMIIPGWTKHTSHFSQNVFFINHRNSHPTWYPPMEALFIPNFVMAKEIKFNKVLLSMLQSSSISPYNITFYPHESMMRMAAVGGRVCFDWLGVNGHLGHHGAGGYFYQLFESDIFRAYAYKYYDLQPFRYFNSRRVRLRVLFLKRNEKSKGRQLLNTKDIKAVIAKKGHMYQYREELIDALPMKEQVDITLQTDILMSVHGAAMATIVFLLPHSAVIELRPPYFRDNWYHVTSTSAKLVHIIHNNFTTALPASCPSADVTLLPAVYKDCWKDVHFQNFVVPFLYLREYLEYAYREVMHYKYHQ